MSKKLEVGKALVDFVTMLGFEEKEADSESKYFVNKLGKQVKINTKTKLISLMNKAGFTLFKELEFSMKELQNFSNM